MLGKQFGRYELIDVLGQGGMATAYRAFDPLMKREVALKVIQSRLGIEEDEWQERMLREAQAIAALEHPAVVPVYDFGNSGGTLYLVMRLMEGGSLRDRLRQGPLSPAETLAVLRRVASALDEAHRLGIVHRDIKPGNVLFDRFGNAYLADFGVARVEDATVTLTGSRLIGTPAYMSPEQVQGAKDLDGRSDVYALGAMTYQMLTGRPPYEGATSVELMFKHIHEPPPDLQAARPDLPSAAAEVIRRAMAKDREARYPTAGAFVEALEAALNEGRFLSPEDTVAPETLTAFETTHPPADAEATVWTPPALEALRRRWVWAFPLLLLLLVAGAWGAWRWLGGGGFAPPTPAVTAAPTQAALAVLPTHTATSVPPTATASPTPPPPTATVTATPLPSPTATPTPAPTQGPLVIGGADLLAFVASDNNIYLSTMDGAQVRPLTQDGAEKHELQWLSYNRRLYLSGKCVFLADVARNQVELLTCFPTVDRLDSFRISPDGQQVAIVADGVLIVTTYDPAALQQVSSLGELQTRTHICATFGRDEVLQVRWANDGKTVSARVRVPSEGRAIEQIEVLRVDCRYGITRQHIFPGKRFEMTTFDQVPIIPSFDWDGDKLYVFNLFWRNRGYGDLYLYSRDTYLGQLINPIGGQCCYRDPRWSPDGRYLLVAFQDMRQGQDSRTSLYLVPVGTWGTGMTYSPLPLPQELFTDPRVAPVPALRPAQP